MLCADKLRPGLVHSFRDDPGWMTAYQCGGFFELIEYEWNFESMAGLEISVKDRCGPVELVEKDLCMITLCVCKPLSWHCKDHVAHDFAMNINVVLRTNDLPVLIHQLIARHAGARCHSVQVGGGQCLCDFGAHAKDDEAPLICVYATD